MIGTGFGSASAALDSGPTLAVTGEEACVVAHQEVRFDALDDVESDADHDQESGASQECGHEERNLESLGDHRRDDCDDREEACAHGW